jgi:hypothetical protein
MGLQKINIHGDLSELLNKNIIIYTASCKKYLECRLIHNDDKTLTYESIDPENYWRTTTTKTRFIEKNVLYKNIDNTYRKWWVCF